MHKNAVVVNKKINRLIISRNDWVKCNGFLSELDNQEYGSLCYEALLLSAILFYSRPFSCNERESASSADPVVDKAVLQGFNEISLNGHKKIIILRNKAIAHMEWVNNPVGVDGAVVQGREFSIWQHFKKSDIGLFSSIVSHLLNNSQKLIGDFIYNGGDNSC